MVDEWLILARALKAHLHHYVLLTSDFALLSRSKEPLRFFGHAGHDGQQEPGRLGGELQTNYTAPFSNIIKMISDETFYFFLSHDVIISSFMADRYRNCASDSKLQILHNI